MEVPKLEKIVVNIGVGEASHDSKFIEAAAADLLPGAAAFRINSCEWWSRILL